MKPMRDGEVREFRFLPRREETPAGWADVDARHDTHHDQHSILIERDPMTTTEALVAERGTTHGDWLDNAEIIQATKRLWQTRPGWAALHPHERETLEMIAVKVGRILAGDPHFHDHWLDICGYAKLSADRNIPEIKK